MPLRRKDHARAVLTSWQPSATLRGLVSDRGQCRENTVPDTWHRTESQPWPSNIGLCKASYSNGIISWRPIGRGACQLLSYRTNGRHTVQSTRVKTMGEEAELHTHRVSGCGPCGYEVAYWERPQCEQLALEHAPPRRFVVPDPEGGPPRHQRRPAHIVPVEGPDMRGRTSSTRPQHYTRLSVCTDPQP